MISKLNAEQILGPFLSRFRDCIVQAFQKYRTDYKTVSIVHTQRSRASLIHDHMIAFAREFLGGDPQIQIFAKRGLSLVNVKDNLLIRFKKLDAKRHSRDNATQQNFLFTAQLDLPGISSELTHLQAGYVLNELQTGLEGVYITCPNGKHLEWFIDLTLLPSTKVAEFTQPKTPAPPVTEIKVAKRRIRPKKDRKDKKNEGDQP